MQGNFGFAETLLNTLKKHDNKCPVMLSSSLQASLAGRFGKSEYGMSKKAGEDLFYDYAAETGAKVLVYRFPNLFGKWCRPNYNSAVATFCNNIANDLPITVNDPSVELEMVFIEDFIKNQLEYNLLSTGEGVALKVSLCSKKQNPQYQQLITGHLFFKRIQNGTHSTVIDVSEYHTDPIATPPGMCDVTNSDITLVVSVLMMIYKLSRTIVKKYVDLKFIRNTQIAHAGNGDIKITEDLITDFYFTVICPVVENSKQSKFSQ